MIMLLDIVMCCVVKYYAVSRVLPVLLVHEAVWEPWYVADMYDNLSMSHFV